MLARVIAAIILPALLVAAPLRAADTAADLAELLQLGDIFAIMAREGEDYGAEIRDEMFPGADTPDWTQSVADIYAVGRILPLFVETMSAALAKSNVDLAPAVTFFGSDLGRRVTALEVSARRALLDDVVSDASRLKLDEMQAEGDARLALIEEFVTVNDLVDANVTGALNGSFAFYRGLADAGAFKNSSEGEMLAEVGRQEASIRSETDRWIHAYLALAYAPLSDEDLQAYIAFSRTDAARELNRAIFASFDLVFADVSRRLGQTAGQILAGSDL